MREFIPTEYTLANYDMFVNDNPSRGVALYMEKQLNAQACGQLNNTAFRESVWCQFESDNKEKCLIGCIYRSPNSTEENTQELCNILKKRHYEKI